MKLKSIFLTVLTSLLVTLVGCKDSSSAPTTKGEYPSKPVNVIIAYKAGGGTDVGARILLSEAQNNFPQPFVVVNKPGADGEIGYTELAKANPDGYTVGFINLPTFVSLPLQRKTQFSKDSVEPIMNHVYDPGVFVVKGDAQWDTLEEFVDAAKLAPNTLTVSNNGTGASNHIGAAHLAYETGIDVVHVPFGGSTDMIAALRGGHVNATVAKISEVGSLIRNGELKALAMFSENRLEDFKDIPTLKEKNIDVLFGSARAIVAPKGVDPKILEQLHTTFKTALESPGNIEKSKNADLPLMYMNPGVLKEYMNNQEVYIKEIVPKLGL